MRAVIIHEKNGDLKNMNDYWKTRVYGKNKYWEIYMTVLDFQIRSTVT